MVAVWIRIYGILGFTGLWEMMCWMVYMICAPPFRIKTPVETTHALSLPGVIAHHYWAAFPKKIISRKDARPQRERRYFS
jgi:hypothetical protein